MGLATAGCLAATGRGARAAAAAPFGLEVGVARMALPASGAGLLAFIDRANAQEGIVGLPAEMNPTVLDPAKMVGFVAALSRLPGPILARLAGHYLMLRNPGLQVQIVYPSRAADFSRPFQLVIEQIVGLHVIAHVDLRPDLDLARSRAAQAASLLPASVADLARVQRAGPDATGELRPAMERRMAIARTWRINADAWMRSTPCDPAARSSFAAADQAVDVAVMSPRDGTIDHEEDPLHGR